MKFHFTCCTESRFLSDFCRVTVETLSREVMWLGVSYNCVEFYAVSDVVAVRIVFNAQVDSTQHLTVGRWLSVSQTKVSFCQHIGLRAYLWTGGVMRLRLCRVTGCRCRRRIEEEERDRDRKRVEKLRRRDERRVEREERRRVQKLEAKRLNDERKMQRRIAIEERNILIAQRKLETIRLLSDLFARIKVRTHSYTTKVAYVWHQTSLIWRMQ